MCEERAWRSGDAGLGQGERWGRGRAGGCRRGEQPPLVVRRMGARFRRQSSAPTTDRIGVVLGYVCAVSASISTCGSVARMDADALCSLVPTVPALTISTSPRPPPPTADEIQRKLGSPSAVGQVLSTSQHSQESREGDMQRRMSTGRAVCSPPRPTESHRTHQLFAGRCRPWITGTSSESRGRRTLFPSPLDYRSLCHLRGIRWERIGIRLGRIVNRRRRESARDGQVAPGCQSEL